LFVGFGALYWIYTTIGLSTIINAWLNLDIAFFFAALLMQIGSYFVGSLRWLILLSAADVQISYFKTLPSYYLGLFFNQFLPTGIGGDGVRCYQLYRQGYSGSKVAASTLFDRLIGLIALILLLSLAIIFSEESIVTSTARLMSVIALSVTLFCSFLVLFVLKHRWLNKMSLKYKDNRIMGLIFRIISIFQIYGKSRQVLGISLLISFFMQVMMISVYVILAYGLNLDIGLGVFFITIPLVFLAAIVPISLGGLGTREAALIGVLGLFGYNSVDSSQLALVFLILLWISVLPGIYPLLFYRPRNNDNN
jgi:uncharacterized protein (TIRG00374 family)